MAINKNFVVKHGLEVGDQLIHANTDDAKVGIASTQPNVELDVRGGIAATNTTVSGVSTVQTALRVGSGIAGTIFSALDDNVVGVGTSQPIFLLDVRAIGVGTTALYVQGDARITGDLDVGAGVSVAGLSTFVGVGTFYEGFISAGIATVKQLEVLGFSTFRANLDLAADVGITSSLVVGAGLSVAGISTLTGLLDIDGGVTVTGVSTFSTNVDVNADVDINRSLAITGGATVTGLSTFTGNVDINSDVDINRSLSVTGGSTVTGLSTFSSNVDINADLDVNRSVSITGGLGVTGIGTIGRVKIFNDGTGGIVTATTGIITYYGDGQFLTNIQSGVGIATTNPTTGYSETVGLGATIITFAGPGVSTDAQHNGGTGVTVNAASGIATVYLAGGGSGGGFQTIIEKDSTTVGAGGSDIFTATNAYTAGYINVYVNGARLDAADFTETTPASGIITLASAATEGDIVELENFRVTAITGDFETKITREFSTVTVASKTAFTLSTEYVSGYIDVYLNGVKLTSSSDFTETDSTTITLTTAATFGDILEFVIFEKRSISELAPVWRNDNLGAGAGGIYTFTSVGVGTSAQTSFFEVYGPSKFRTGVVTFTNSDDTDIIRITDGGFNVISGITTLGGSLECVNITSSGNLDINGTDHDIVGTTALDNVWVSAGATIEGNLTLTGSGSTSSIAGALQLTNVNVSGVHTSGFAVVTNDLTVNGNMTVNGTTTTLDSVVQEVDLMNIQANSSTPAIGVTQSGAGPIIAAYDAASEVFRVDDGGDVAVADKIIHLGDTNTAIRFPAADTFTVETGGSERIRIRSNGVIIKGNSGTQETLGNGANTQLIGSGSADASLALIRQASGGGEFYFAAGTSGTNIANNNGLGFIKFMGYHTNGYDEYARIEAYVDGTNGDGDAPGRLIFKTTADGASSPTERLRITSDGKLATNGASSIDCGDGGMHLYLGDGARNDYSTSADGLIIEKNGTTGLSIDPGSSGTANIFFPNESNHSVASISHNNSTGELRVRGEDHIILSTNSNTERLRITSGGNVNIGGNYTQTTYTSQITGTLNVTSTITQNGATVATTGKAIAMAMVFG